MINSPHRPYFSSPSSSNSSNSSSVAEPTMADRFAALAGFDGSAEDDTTADTDQSAVRPDLPGLDTEESVRIPPTTARANVTQRRKPSMHAKTPLPTETHTAKAETSAAGAATSAAKGPARPITPPSNRTRAAGDGGDPPSTMRKADPRRRYSVRIADDDLPQDSFDDSTSDSPEAELMRVQAELSGDSNVDTTVGSPDKGAAGSMAMRALRNRRQSGLTLREAGEKLKQLELERDDLKIEVDFHRSKMSLEDAQLELLSLRKSHKKTLDKCIEVQKICKAQSKTMKEAQKIWQKTEKDILANNTRLEQELQEERARAEEDRNALQQSEEEMNRLKRRQDADFSRQESDVGDVTAQVSAASVMRAYMGANPTRTNGGNARTISDHAFDHHVPQAEIARLREELDAQREESEDALREIQRERDHVADQLEQAQDDLEHALANGKRDRDDDSLASSVGHGGAREQRLKRTIGDLEEVRTQTGFPVDKARSRRRLTRTGPLPHTPA